MPGLEQRLRILIGKHCARGILVDTNVLLLYLFGLYQPDAIGRKRLERYTLGDAELIVHFIGRFEHVLTTQHVLAETSNLARQIISGTRQRELLRQLHPLFCLPGQHAFKSRNVSGTSVDAELFARLGLTDASLASLVAADTLLLTDDLDLYVAAVSNGGDAINFTHMREAAGTV